MAGIFDGVRVLELGAGDAGPFATRYLAEHGATVVKVESAAHTDRSRPGQQRPDARSGPDGSPACVRLDPNPLGVVLDLSQPDGAALALRLVEWADVVVESFSPGALAQWGLDDASLRARKPALVTVSICLFGQTGPQRESPGFDAQGSALAGFDELTGWPDREGMGPYASIADSLSPRYVALLVAAALRHRERTGEGQHLDLSQVETGVHGLSEMRVRHAASGESLCRAGHRCEHAAPHGVYPCRGQERWIALAIFSDIEWKLLRRKMGNPPFGQDPRFATLDGRLAFADELDAEIARWSSQQDAFELAERLQAVGVEAGVVQDLADLHADPQLAHRGHFEALRHALPGERRFGRCAIRFSESPSLRRTPGPSLGEHAREVLSGILGLADAEIERLAATGVLR